MRGLLIGTRRLLPTLLLLCWPVQRSATLTRGLLSRGRSEVLHVEVEEVRRRPIITGCLEECGTGDQSCVTECQVCVESNKCPQLMVNCSVCVEEMEEIRAELRRLGNVGRDSGGVALAHEGVRQHLQLARLQAIEGERALRSARAGVLTAQRTAEWAEEETHQEEAKVAKEKEHLVQTEKDQDRWSRRSKAKLKEIRGARVWLKKDILRTKRQLRIANKALAETQQEVMQARDLAYAGASARKAMITARVVAQLHWKLKKQQEELHRFTEAYKKQKKDSKWFQRGLNKEIEKVARLVHKREGEMERALSMQQKTRKQLQAAKDSYRGAADRSQNLTSEAATLQRALLKNPLPSYVPPEVRQQQKRADASA